MTLEDLDSLIEEISIDTYDDNEVLSAFYSVLEDELDLPCDAFVIGEPVSLVGFDYDGNERRGLMLRCRKEDGSEYSVSASEVTLAEQSKGGNLIAAYRRWLGLNPWPKQAATSRTKKRHKATATDLDISGPIELVVLSVKERAARCRLVDNDRILTLRTVQLDELVPGEIAVVKPQKQWTYGGHPYLSGEIQATRIDIEALGLVPLKLESRGLWQPEKEYWGEDDKPIEEWAQKIIARGPRLSYEMEQVLPGWDPDAYDSDPICESSELKEAGDYEAARQILMDLCQADLRCLDAHAHLGNLYFQSSAKEAKLHYEVGFRIGELSFGLDFNGLLPWSFIDNRPFLRCMYGFGLCLWHIGRFEEAELIFDRMFWLNPGDDQGVRFFIDDIHARIAWEDREV